VIKTEKLKNSVGSETNQKWLTAVVANSDGEIFELEGYAAVGMSGTVLKPLMVGETQSMPFGGELMLLPDRTPILYDVQNQRLEAMTHHPSFPSENIYPVAAFNSPGYVVTHISGYRAANQFKPLPLFSYGAVGWHQDAFRSAVVCVDRERRQDLRLMKKHHVIAGVESMRKKLPGNRLRRHLETCALTYGCPAGKNFFLGRYEAPLPTAGACNAECLGCLSLQKNTEISCSQERISFTPRPEEIAAVALIHIENVAKGIVSFGQGCEGDPLLATHVIDPAVRLIRSKTAQGTIHLNTNGSLTKKLERLISAGIDSVRISINSFREKWYQAYFRPKNYGFSDIMNSIELSLKRGLYVSINYLNMPGVTDTPEELESLFSFLKNYPIHMIQWRNLNFDPLCYYETMNRAASCGEALGVSYLLSCIQKAFPDLSFGYFNPPKEKWGLVKNIEPKAKP
jgi:MoaA/NifB/PqqE/SkfB family radical SAM enzyme